MSYRSFNVNLRNVPFYDQRDKQMWKGSSVKDVQWFMDAGCGVCATAMALANYERDSSIDVDDVISRGYCTAYNPTIKDWTIDFKIVRRDLYSRIAEEVIENKKAVIVYVPESRNADSHFVTVCGFRGTLPLDPDGYVNYSCATPDMIKIQDPWKGECSTLEELEDQRTYATSIRIKK